MWHDYWVDAWFWNDWKWYRWKFNHAASVVNGSLESLKEDIENSIASITAITEVQSISNITWSEVIHIITIYSPQSLNSYTCGNFIRQELSHGKTKCFELPKTEVIREGGGFDAYTEEDAAELARGEAAYIGGQWLAMGDRHFTLIYGILLRCSCRRKQLQFFLDLRVTSSARTTNIQLAQCFFI
jgi:hypothetical protein